MAEEKKDKFEENEELEETTTPSADTEQSEEAEQKEEELTPEQKLAAAEAEIADLKDKLLRKVAEFDNYRKRVIAEKTELILNGSQTAVKAILPVLDDLERALPNIKKATDVAAAAEGVELIHQKFLKVLEGMGVKPIETQDAEFNVELHEAIAQVPGVADEQKGKVIDCVERGYMLNDKVLRYAKVAVGM
ncbi:MAG: nucleotide exchange factor GrpE [Bacteroidaceae bacterium]|nr:nucleotide exchange factor GrpE [Bacteroidaceae bacterium]